MRGASKRVQEGSSEKGLELVDGNDAITVSKANWGLVVNVQSHEGVEYLRCICLSFCSLAVGFRVLWLRGK